MQRHMLLRLQPPFELRTLAAFTLYVGHPYGTR